MWRWQGHIRSGQSISTAEVHAYMQEQVAKIFATTTIRTLFSLNRWESRIMTTFSSSQIQNRVQSASLKRQKRDRSARLLERVCSILATQMEKAMMSGCSILRVSHHIREEGCWSRIRITTASSSSIRPRELPRHGWTASMSLQVFHAVKLTHT